MNLPVVAIVGATNVGKSTLFNRLVGRRRAIATDEPGMTRDRIYGVVEGGGRTFRLVDTGGVDPGSRAPFAREIEQQATLALDEAALVLFVVDARGGVTAIERELAARLRRRSGPLLLVANKADTEALAARAVELWELGLGAPFPVSAEHGRGTDELVEAIQAELGPGESTDTAEAEEGVPKVILVGRPNVGKSSVFNRLVGQERALVSDVPGTTRDTVDTLLTVGERRYRLIDTAGLRRPGHVQRGAERFSVQRAMEQLRRCDVAILVLDASVPFAAQDAHVAGHAHEAFKPLVVAVNKWDLVQEREDAVKRWEEELRQRLRFTRDVPVVFVSAKSGQRVSKLLDQVDQVHAWAGLRIPTPAINRWLGALPLARPTPTKGPPGLRIYYATQTGVHPPSFALFCNAPSRVHFSVARRIENSLRESFGFGSAPLRLRFRGRQRDKPA
jgi:GTPase